VWAGAMLCALLCAAVVALPSTAAAAISTSPTAGTTHAAGAKVALTISSGKAKTKAGKGSSTETCKVPKVRGKKLAAAKTALKHAHCATGKVTHKASKTVAKGKVISSKPGAGSKHKAGTKVALTVSSGKAKTTSPKKSCVVPNVVGDTLAAAKTALKKANCSTGTVTRKASGTVAKGDVISSSPKAGTKHKAGTKVKLTVSSGPAYSVPKS
jgi:eukaryotic-like serine/threonine-protein kinase